MNARRFASIAGTTAVTTIAAIGSYDHMRTLAGGHGQSPFLAWLLPLSVDGMLLVSTVALGDGRKHRGTAWLAFFVGVAASLAANIAATPGGPVARIISAWPAIALLLTVEVLARSAKPEPAAAPAPFAWAAPEPAEQTFRLDNTEATFTPSPFSIPRLAPAAAEESDRATRTYRRQTDTLALAEEIRAAEPEITHDELAARLELSPKRLRAVLAGQAA